MSGSAIELVDVTKRFDTKLAVKSVSLSIPAGQCFGLIGPNGAGKTTTFSMMCGFLFPTSGSLRVLGVDPSVPGALKRKVGVLPQDSILPPSLPVGALLTYWARLSGLAQPRDEAERVLARVGLSETWGVLPPNLSHGMAKRVALAQALMGDPPLVLLDEPTAGLDPKVAAHVRSIIQEIRGQRTVVVSSHNLQELEELCDAAAILDRGTLVQSGSMGTLTAQTSEFTVQLARGDVPLLELRSLRGVSEAKLETGGMLVVRFEAKQAPAEEVITAVVGLLAQRGVLLLGVQRGRRLEARVLELT